MFQLQLAKLAALQEQKVQKVQEGMSQMPTHQGKKLTADLPPRHFWVSKEWLYEHPRFDTYSCLIETKPAKRPATTPAPSAPNSTASSTEGGRKKTKPDSSVETVQQVELYTYQNTSLLHFLKTGGTVFIKGGS